MESGEGGGAAGYPRGGRGGGAGAWDEWAVLEGVI